MPYNDTSPDHLAAYFSGIGMYNYLVATFAKNCENARFNRKCY
jgi:hypothetical protein